VIVELPVFTGGVKVIVACVLLAVAVTLVGASGTPAGVTEFDAVDVALVPIAFVAVIVNVYAVPFVNPVTVIGLPVELAVNPPTFDVAV
jgi:Na+/proline symporter